MTDSDYDSRREKIQHRKIAQGQKDLSRKCHCGLIRAHHTAVQANRCKKAQQGESTIVSQMTDRDISRAEFLKI
jgi:hypothetical protein